MERTSTMKRLRRLVVVGFVAGALCGRADDIAAAAMVSGQGCVTAGVQKGCYVLDDTGTGTTFNLLFRKGKVPTKKVVITFEGETHSGPTICMQGTALDVKKWNYTKQPCPAKTVK